MISPNLRMDNSPPTAIKLLKFHRNGYGSSSNSSIPGYGQSGRAAPAAPNSFRMEIRSFPDGQSLLLQQKVRCHTQ
jgi:hypothetical protein